MKLCPDKLSFALPLHLPSANYSANGLPRRVQRGNRLCFGIHPALWPERFAEGVGEVVAVLEIGAAIFLGFCEQAGLHHVEDDFAKVLATPDTPFLEHGHGHRTKLLEGKLPDAVEQFLAGDVADGAAALLADEFLREIERLADKSVGVARVTRVPRDDDLNRFVKIDLLHFNLPPSGPRLPSADAPRARF